MLPNIPDAAMTMEMSWEVPFGAVLVLLLLAVAAIGVIAETGVLAALASRPGRREPIGRRPIATATPRS